MTTKMLALRDAIATTLVRLADECEAVLLTTPGGFDHEVARRERQHYEDLLARQLRRLADETRTGQ